MKSTARLKKLRRYYKNEENMKITTGKGDTGTAGLLNGTRILKSDHQIEAVGDIDELNSALGVLQAVFPESEKGTLEEINTIQSDLLHMGAWVATPRTSPSLQNLEGIDDKDITYLESAIDRMDSLLPPLKGFILPKGNLAASWSHLARTICRRAERHVVRLSVQTALGNKPKHLANILKYLNRLSDYLFVLARYCNHMLDRRDSIWETSRRVSNPDNIK